MGGVRSPDSIWTTLWRYLLCVRRSRLISVARFFFSSRRRHTSCSRDWSSDVCSSDLIPDLAGAVRGREPGESPVAALHRFYRAELDRRAEWTQLHDGVTPFARMTLASPTLVGAFARAWGEVEVQLARAFAEIDGDPDGVTAGAVAGRAMMLLQSG